MRFQVCPIWWMNIDFKENGGKKSILAIPKHQTLYPNKENVFIVPKHKNMEIIVRIYGYPIWQMNFDSKENGVKKNFSC